MREDLRNPERQLANVSYIVSRGAELHPDRIALDDLLNDRRLSYGELDARVTRLARALIRAGVEKGDMVAAMFWNEHAMVETIFACARIGAIVAPLNVRLLPSDVAEYVNGHDCRAIVANADFADSFADTKPTIRIARGGVAGWQDFETILAAETDEYLPVTMCFDEPYLLVSTGGTTGKSKGVLHSHVGTLFTVLADIAEYGIRRGWQTLSVLPAYHVAGMEWGMFTILWRGGTVVFPASTSFDPVRYLAEIRARDIEYLPLVPALINPIYDAWDGTPLTGPRTVVTTAAPTPAPLRRKLTEMFPQADIMAAAGLSESLNMATQSPGEFLEYPDSIGTPHVDTRVLILDDDDRVVTRGAPGHIAMRNFNTALGYHGNPEAAAVTWRARAHDPEGLHWCFTGDIGVMDEDGRVTIVDRSKDVILTGGESVPSVEIETVYAEHPGITDCAAIGRRGCALGRGHSFGRGKERRQRQRHRYCRRSVPVRPRPAGGLQGTQKNRLYRCSAPQPFRQGAETRPARPEIRARFRPAARRLTLPASSAVRIRQKCRQVRRAVGGMAGDQEVPRAVDNFRTDISDRACKHVRYGDDHRVGQRPTHQQHGDIKGGIILRHRVEPERAMPVQHVRVCGLAAIILSNSGQRVERSVTAPEIDNPLRRIDLARFIRGFVRPAHRAGVLKQIGRPAMAHQAKRIGLECRDAGHINVSRQGGGERNGAAERVPHQMRRPSPGAGHGLFDHADLMGDIMISGTTGFGSFAIATERRGNHPVPGQQLHDRPPGGRRAERPRHKDDDRAIAGFLKIHLCRLSHARFPCLEYTRRTTDPTDPYPPVTGYHMVRAQKPDIAFATRFRNFSLRARSGL
jgi:fatty-acyl-CoA synthase